jgi:hypothetical protein
MLAFALQAAPAEATVCTVSGTVPSLTVLSGQQVVLCGHVLGGVTVNAGGGFESVGGSSIGGPVVAKPGSLYLDLEGTHIGSSVTATSLVGDGSTPSFAVEIDNSTINGAVTVSNAGGLVEIGFFSGRNVISGALNATNDLHGLDVFGNRIGGAVSITNDEFGYGSLIGDCSTTCTDAAEVSANRISGSLICERNPNGVFEFEFEPNVVAGATVGQCNNEGTLK